MARSITAIACLLLLCNTAAADDLALLRMGIEKRNALVQYLEQSPCDCGCGMTIGQCLRDDPSCPVSPELARSAIAELNRASEAAHHTDLSGSYSSEGNTSINNSQNGSVVSGNVDGKNCTYASAGGMTIKTCD